MAASARAMPMTGAVELRRPTRWGAALPMCGAPNGLVPHSYRVASSEYDGEYDDGDESDGESRLDELYC